ncbi:hypothetical protein BH09PSE3_BH09PSE3_14340 [soil metagenome]
MTSRLNAMENHDVDSISDIVNDLQSILVRMDTLELSHAGAMLASVLDILIDPVSGANAGAQSNRS